MNNNLKNNKLNPVVVYENADVDKLKIFTDNRNASGVYRWINKTTGKSYIGSGINLTKRFYLYYSFKALTSVLNNGNSVIARALLKSGYSNFRLEILEYCDPLDVIEREQYYIDLLRPEYNILKTAGSRLGHKHYQETINKISEGSKGKILSEETKDKISTAMEGKILDQETKDKMSVARLGYQHSQETKDKISASSLGKTRSQETKDKISDSKKGQPRPAGAGTPSQQIEVLDNNNNTTTYYESISEAARALGVKKQALYRYLKGTQANPYKNRYVFTSSGRRWF
jgi:group I intron endonuclease